jgi:hypothetical protein
MKIPKIIPLTNNPRCKDPKKIPLYPEAIEDDVWQKIELDHCSPPIFAKINKSNENNNKDNSQSIQQLESESSD